MGSFLDLLVGTALLRPYVVAFLALYLALAWRDLGGRGAWALLGAGYAVALGAELVSTRVGVPFGLYHYTGRTIGAELFVSNVPVFDSLSFPFLAYASWCLARWAGGPSRAPRTVVVAAVLMMLLDVVIDPLAVRGDRWFLGHLFSYAENGVYWGVPLSNFAGWALVGGLILGLYARVLGRRWPPRASPAPGVAFYYVILAFNLALTWWIGEPTLLAAGILLHLAVFLVLWFAGGWLSAGASSRAPDSTSSTGWPSSGDRA